jgi:hypothetical protein
MRGKINAGVPGIWGRRRKIRNEAGMLFVFKRIGSAVHASNPVCSKGTGGLGLETRKSGNSKMETWNKVVGEDEKRGTMPEFDERSRNVLLNQRQVAGVLSIPVW